MAQFAVLSQYDDLIDHNTPSIDFKDLMNQNCIEEWAKAQNSEEKRGQLVNILVTYLMRHLEESESDDLAEVVMTMGKAKIDQLQVFVQRKEMLHKYLQKRLKEKQIKFAPLEIADEDCVAYPCPWPPVDKGKEKDEKDSTNPYAVLEDKVVENQLNENPYMTFMSQNG